MFDILIIGAGPAGMSAAIYAKRAGLDVGIFEGEMYGGQMILTPEVENYPGIAKISGAELSYTMSEQMRALGATIIDKKVEKIAEADGVFSLVADGEEYLSKTVIIANGAKRRKLGIPGEEKYIGRGVSYCAVCDGMFFKGKTVVVVGGGNTALEDAVYLSRICEKVYLVHRRDEFRAKKILVDAVLSTDNIEILYNTVPVEIMGDMKVSAIKLRTGEEEREIDTGAVFVAIGLIPENEIFEGFIELSDGYIFASDDTHTSRKGVFAAGDTRAKSLRQIVTAASDGAIAATEAEKYINE